MKTIRELDRLASLDTILVATVWRGKFRWFCSVKEDWVLNQTSWSHLFGENDTTCASRHGICILSENTIDAFMICHFEYEIKFEELRAWFKNFIPLRSWDDDSHLFPALLINFDKRELFSMFSESSIFETYLPEYWIGKIKFIPPEIPEDQQYWIIDGIDFCSILQTE